MMKTRTSILVSLRMNFVRLCSKIISCFWILRDAACAIRRDSLWRTWCSNSDTFSHTYVTCNMDVILHVTSPLKGNELDIILFHLTLAITVRVGVVASIQDNIFALGNVHTNSFSTSLRTVPRITFETVILSLSFSVSESLNQIHVFYFKDCSCFCWIRTVYFIM